MNLGMRDVVYIRKIGISQYEIKCSLLWSLIRDTVNIIGGYKENNYEMEFGEKLHANTALLAKAIA